MDGKIDYEVEKFESWKLNLSLLLQIESELND